MPTFQCLYRVGKYNHNKTTDTCDPNGDYHAASMSWQILVNEKTKFYWGNWPQERRTTVHQTIGRCGRKWPLRIFKSGMVCGTDSLRKGNLPHRWWTSAICRATLFGLHRSFFSFVFAVQCHNTRRLVRPAFTIIDLARFRFIHVVRLVVCHVHQSETSQRVKVEVEMMR